MLKGVMRIMERTVTNYKTRRLHGAITERKERQRKTKLIREYGQQYSCITLPEARWIFQHLPRWEKYYTFYLLMASTGIRACELVLLSLDHFDKKTYSSFTYPVAKRRQYVEDDDTFSQREKWRTVHLDPWVRDELLTYLKRHCSTIGPDGNILFVTPWHGINDDGDTVTNLLFPFRKVVITLTFWSKIRERMRAAGFDVDRLERQTTNTKGTARNTFVLRQHMWRGFYCAIEYYKAGMDMKAVQAKISHSKIETTARYCKSAEQLGSNAQELARITWQEITGHHTPTEELLTP